MNAPSKFPEASGRQEKLVVIGNGMAGCRAVEEILARDPARYAVTIFGAEPRVNYNRIMLSPVLAGEKSFDDIIINTPEWYAENGIVLVSGDPVVSINREAKEVVSRSGRVEPYDRLLIATGSDPFIIPVPGKDLPGVVTFRDLDDVDKMLAAAGKGGNAVVIGGGLLGLEAAHGLSLRGMKVSVIHLMPTLMERQLDEAAGWLLKAELERRGQDILTGADTAEILEKDGHVAGVLLKDGRTIPADIVVMAVGIRPATMLAKTAGLQVERGIMVDDHMITSDPDVMAVGECVQHRGACYGLVAPLWDMCRALADHATATPGANPGDGYAGSVTSTKLKVSGIDVFSAGDFSGGDDCEDIVMRDAARGIYKRVIVKDSRLIGAVLYGDTADGSWYFDLLKKGEDIAEIREALIFGQAFAAGGALADPNAAVAALSDDAEICGCNGVSKGQVVACIGAGAHSLDAVRSTCKASASCGSCTGLVESLLALTLGVKIERMTWGSWMPHKFKIAVSGCPRNCAEATIKDFGVICVDSGYELHVGGNGGIHLRGTDLLCKVTTEEEAMDHCAAFIQLYREDAHYLERTAPWVERKGIDWLRAALLDDPQTIQRLAARFRHSQQFMQDDPWAKRVEGDRRDLHRHLGTIVLRQDETVAENA